MVGCSYAAALTAWVQALAPGTFWAYHASSAPVEHIYDFWEYASTIEKGIPHNCSTDLAQVIEHIDDVLSTGTNDEVNSLKALFGLEALVHHDDFAWYATPLYPIHCEILLRTDHDMPPSVLWSLQLICPGRATTQAPSIICAMLWKALEIQ